MKICFEPSPVCPIIPFPLFMKFILNFLCALYYVPCFCFQQGWSSMSGSLLRQTADDTAHCLPSGKGPSLTREMVQLQPAEPSAVKAASMLWAYCIGIVPRCRQHHWAVRQVSAAMAESPISAQHHPLLSAGRVPVAKPPWPPLPILRDKDVILHPLDKGESCTLMSFHCC